MELEAFDMSDSNIVDDLSNLFWFCDGGWNFEDDSPMVGNHPKLCPHHIGISIV